MKARSLPHFNERPSDLKIDTIVIHSVYCPTAPDIFDEKLCIDLLDEHKVSAHYVINREGGITSLVDEAKRAWHAGPSAMPFADDPRTDLNNFSIGIELIGSESSGFTDKQYGALQNLISDILTRHPISAIVGHDTVAPDRKCDPGPCFDWSSLKNMFNKVRFV